jgi:surface antigen
MRHRLVLATAALGVAAIAAPAALAAPAPPVLDGKKVTKLSLTGSGGLQDNDKDAADLSGADRADCAAPRCMKLVFVYNPAKGVKGDALFTASWSNPASDIDLYVASVNKDGSTSEVGGHCGGVGGVSEKVFVPAGTLKPGKKYALVADFFRSLNETVTGTVEMPKGDFARPVPAEADSVVYPVNCEI